MLRFLRPWLDSASGTKAVEACLAGLLSRYADFEPALGNRNRFLVDRLQWWDMMSRTTRPQTLVRSNGASCYNDVIPCNSGLRRVSTSTTSYDERVTWSRRPHAFSVPLVRTGPLLVLVVRVPKPRAPEVDGVLTGHCLGILCAVERRLPATIQV